MDWVKRVFILYLLSVCATHLEAVDKSCAQMTGELGQSVISNSPQALKILNHPIAFEALWFSPKIKTMIAQLGLKIPEFRSELKFDSVTENLDYMNFYYDFYEEIKSRPALLQNFADWLLKVKEKYEAALIAAKSINPEFKQGYTNEQLFRAASDAVQFTSGLRNLPSNASDQIPLAERTKKLIDLNQPLEGEDLSPEELDDLVKENLKRAKRIPIEGEATQLPTKESLAAHFGNIMGEVEYKVFDAEEKRSALGSIPSQNRAAWFQAATDFMEAETSLILSIRDGLAKLESYDEVLGRMVSEATMQGELISYVKDKKILNENITDLLNSIPSNSATKAFLHARDGRDQWKSAVELLRRVFQDYSRIY